MKRTFLVAALLFASGLPFARAQERPLPERTKLGTLEIVVFPQARLDGKDVTLAPGTRIWNESNMIALPQSVTGRVQVLYRVDPLGQVAEAWVLTPAELERAKKRAAQESSR